MVPLTTTSDLLQTLPRQARPEHPFAKRIRRRFLPPTRPAERNPRSDPDPEFNIGILPGALA